MIVEEPSLTALFTDDADDALDPLNKNSSTSLEEFTLDWEQLKALVAKEPPFTALFTREALFTLIANKLPLTATFTEEFDEALTTLNVIDSSLTDLYAEIPFEDISLTPPDNGGILDGRDLFAKKSIGHDVNIKVKRLDKPKVKVAPGSYPVKLPLKDDSLTPLSSDKALTISIINNPPSATFEDVSSTSLDGGGIILDAGLSSPDSFRWTTHSDDISPALFEEFKAFVLNLCE